jgi:5-methylcytosine-specific restriction endonuclease McrA
VPRHLGGGNESSNLQVLCTTCNSAKGTRIDWPYGTRPGHGVPCA